MHSMCNQLNINISDWDDRQYISSEEVIALLKKRNLYPVNKEHQQFSIQQIEDTIRSYSWISDAQCYCTNMGDFVIDIKQCIPLLKVENNAENYYIDMRRQRLSVRQNIQADVIHVKGAVGERAAKQEIADMVAWIGKDKYWREKITTITVVNPRLLELTLNDHSKVVLGEITAYEKKLRKLRILLDKGLSQMDEAPNIKEYDLRYNGQVITR